MLKKTMLSLALGLAIISTTAVAQNAAPMAPAGGAYQPVADLVALPNHIPGIGTLYVDPATLPAGPFAAYDKTSQLVSTIYMIPLAELQDQTSYSALEVAGGNVESVDMYYNAGHPGVDTPHYHIVLWHVDAASADVQ